MCNFKEDYTNSPCVKHDLFGNHILANSREYPIIDENPKNIGIDPAIGSMDMPIRTTWQAGMNLGIGHGV